MSNRNEMTRVGNLENHFLLSGKNGGLQGVSRVPDAELADPRGGEWKARNGKWLQTLPFNTQHDDVSMSKTSASSASRVRVLFLLFVLKYLIFGWL